MGQVSIMEDLMTMDCKKARNARMVEIERVFQSSRLASEFMARAYENLVPIKRQDLYPELLNDQANKLWATIGMEKRQCAV